MHFLNRILLSPIFEQLLCSIADAKDPRDRIIQVVKWYMASYHAGRKSAVAKKPYNPILGEIFRCHWNIPKTYGKLTPTEEAVPEGPIPWCNKNQLVFVAEQVSHHPPSKHMSKILYSITSVIRSS